MTQAFPRSVRALVALGLCAAALATTVSGSQRMGIAIPLILLFLLGILLLRAIKPQGER